MGQQVDPVGQRVDSRLEDPLALDEIELYGDLVIAASSTEGPLSPTQADQVLGLAGGRGDPAPRAAG